MMDYAEIIQNPIVRRPQASSVSVVEAMGEWHVLVVENGIERSQSFLQRNWAENYASGQRQRLQTSLD